MLKVRTLAGIQLHEACVPVQCHEARSTEPPSVGNMAAHSRQSCSHAVMQRCRLVTITAATSHALTRSLEPPDSCWSVQHTSHTATLHSGPRMIKLIFIDSAIWALPLPASSFKDDFISSSCHHFKAYLENKMNTN